MPATTVSVNPTGAVNDNASTENPKKPRKEKRKDSTGKEMSRMILVVTEDQERAILKAVAEQAGSDRFSDVILFKQGDKEEFLGAAIAEIAAEWNLDSDE